MNRSASQLARDLYTGVLDLIYPPFCVVCRKAGNHYLCPECIEKIDLIEPPYCRKCGTPTESYLCSECRDNEFVFEFSRSTGIFEGTLRTAIHTLKYDFHLALADPLADLMVRCFPSTHLAGKIDMVVPVPIHHSRKTERGFNQAEELARRLCKKVSLPIETRALVKSRPTKHQVDLPYEQRALNVTGAFVVKNRDLIQGKRILLIDDVFTTGSTLNEAAKALKNAGSAEIYAYTLARSL